MAKVVVDAAKTSRLGSLLLRVCDILVYLLISCCLRSVSCAVNLLCCRARLFCKFY